MVKYTININHFGPQEDYSKRERTIKRIIEECEGNIILNSRKVDIKATVHSQLQVIQFVEYLVYSGLEAHACIHKNGGKNPNSCYLKLKVQH